jgi:hypothetical protein
MPNLLGVLPMASSIVYAWKSGSQLGHLDAERCYRELDKLKDKHGGDFSAAEVVEAAKSKKSALHSGFEWDDSKAAVLHRLHQASKLQRSLVVLDRSKDNPEPVRAFNIKRVEHGSAKGAASAKRFSTTEEVMKDPDARAALIANTLRQLVELRNRFRQLQELAIVWRAVDEASETVSV